MPRHKESTMPAPASQTASTGAYLVSLWDSTPNVATLNLNQLTTGQIVTPYQVDAWNFAAAANQQVLFHLVAASSPGVLFRLIGPGGFVGFTDLATDSGLVTPPQP